MAYHDVTISKGLVTWDQYYQGAAFYFEINSKLLELVGVVHSNGIWNIFFSYYLLRLFPGYDARSLCSTEASEAQRLFFSSHINNIRVKSCCCHTDALWLCSYMTTLCSWPSLSLLLLNVSIDSAVQYTVRLLTVHLTHSRDQRLVRVGLILSHGFCVWCNMVG